jgi:hypothetical protein
MSKVVATVLQSNQQSYNNKSAQPEDVAITLDSNRKHQIGRFLFHPKQKKHRMAGNLNPVFF